VIGTDIKNEKRAAASRVRRRNKPAVIVAPERDTPGTKASACEQPIITASFQLVESSSRRLRPMWSAHQSSIAITINIVALKRTSMNKGSFSSMSRNAKPATIAGAQAKKIRLRSWACSRLKSSPIQSFQK